MALSAQTRPIETRGDLLQVTAGTGVLFAAPELTLAGHGEAARIAVPRTDPGQAAVAVRRALEAITADDEVLRPGTGPVALGAWPFAPSLDGTLVVPEVLVARAADGAAWITTVATADAGDDAHHRLRTQTLALLDPTSATDGALAGFATDEPSGPATFSVESSRAPAAWCAAVGAARDELRTGAADKVVLAREVRVRADEALPVRAILARLAQRFPSALRFSVDGFVGASPELLVSRFDDIVRCHPMAGTAPRSGDPDTDAALVAALGASAKNSIEHRHTIDLVHESLLAYCSYLDEEAEPSVVHLTNVSHLATLVEGKLSAPPASVVELVCVLHPTPAVCGRPRHAALELIERFEELDRDRYAGPVGWVDAAGNGAFAVGIRSAVIDGAEARVFAGVGVVAESDPAAELAETRAKLDAVLPAIVRP